MEKEKNYKKRSKKFVSQENGGLEVISPNNDANAINSGIIEPNESDNAVSIDKERVNVKKSGNLVVGNLNLVLNPLKRRSEKYYKENIWHLIADIFLVLLIASLILFLFLFNKTKDRDNIMLNIKPSSEDIVASSLTTFELEYRSNIKADNSVVSVLLPENFILESVSPNNLFDPTINSFNLGDLDINSNGKIKINGLVQGGIDDHQTISFNFNCDQCGRSGFNNSYIYNIEKQAIDLLTSVNKNLYLNAEFDGKLLIKNNSDNTLENIKINFGNDIIIKKSDYSIDKGQIIIDNLAALGEKTIDFVAIPKKEGEISITPKINLNSFGQEFSLSGQEFSSTVKAPSLNLTINSNKQNVVLGEKIKYSINYKNEGLESLKDIKINLISGNPNFSITSINSSNLKNAKINNNSLVIYDLLPQESGSIDLEVLFDQRQINANQELFLKADLEYQIADQIIKYSLNSEKNKMISQVSTLVGGYYYSPQGDQLGVGPLPPAVDMATNYWIFLEFNNSGNDLENFSLTAELPENVYFSNNKRVLDGGLIYGEIGKRLIWEISEMSGGTNKYRANFEITLIPGENDLGKVLNLLENIKFTVKDKFVGQELSGNLKNIDTNLESDKLSSGKGRVVNIR